MKNSLAALQKLSLRKKA